jgi:pimeloyl-ACP methyl ester carboxylesterase
MSAGVVFERRGTGTPLVLLHGIGHRWQAWEPVLDRLATRHDVIALDLPGFGASPIPDGGLPVGMANTAAAIAGLFDTYGLDRPHVAGNSLGGAIALELAVAGLVNSATAFSPAGFYTPWERRYAAGLLRAHRIGAHTPGLGWSLRLAPVRALSFGMLMGRPHRLAPEAAYLDAIALRNAPAFTLAARDIRRYLFTGETAPRVPVTIAWGTRDRILLPRQAQRARRLLPGARHVTLPGCGHVPMGDDPDLVARTILETTGAGVPAEGFTAN